MSEAIQQLPFEGSPERQYFEFLQTGQLRIQHCSECKKAVFYPRNICPHCGSSALEWQLSEGRGEVYSVTIVRRSEAAGGDYNVVLIDLDEGVRLMSCIAGLAHDAIQIGLRVKADIQPVADGDPLLVFQPEDV